MAPGQGEDEDPDAPSDDDVDDPKDATRTYQLIVLNTSTFPIQVSFRFRRRNSL